MFLYLAKLELSVPNKITDISFPASLAAGDDYCYVHLLLTGL